MSPQDETLSTSPLSATLPVAAAHTDIACPACGTLNTGDSKFCRNCGQLLRSASAVAKTPVPVPDGEEALTSPQEIDARRAQQLLERAMHLSERGQLPAAILACRQAATLDPNTPAPFAMLGTLLERNGDVRGAMAAYERVLGLSPDSPLERDSLERLRSRIDRAPAFHFDPDELFNDDAMLPSERALLIEERVSETPHIESPLEAPIEARLPPTSTELNLDGASNGEKEDGGALDSLPAVLSPLESAESGLPEILVPPPSAVSVDEPPVAALESAPVSPVVGSAPRIEGGGAGKPAVSSLAQALDAQTLAEAAALAAATSAPLTTELPRNSTLAPVQEIPRTAPRLERRQVERRQVNLPVAVERRQSPRRSATRMTIGVPTNAPGAPTNAHWAPTNSATAPKVAPMKFEFLEENPVPMPLWAQLLRGSSFFARTLPLVAVGALSLGFLSWARSRAVSLEDARAANAPVAVPAATPEPFPTPVPTAAPLGTVAVNPTPPSGGLLVTNKIPTPTPAAPVAPAAPSAPGANNSPRTGATAPRVASRPVAANIPRSAPTFPRVPIPIAPAPVPPAPSNNGSGGNIILPPPRVDTSVPAPPIQVGSALTPGGSARPNTIRITQGTIIRSAVPPRTGSLAKGSERDAAQAERTGQSERAINSLTNALGATGSDAGYLYQQRAMAFLQRGDATSASADFQASIRAYGDQINRGENVAAAQAGMRAARSGLAVAQGR